MRKIREVLRLRFAHRLSQRAIGQSLRLSAGAVNGCLSRARRAGLGWPLPDELDDAQLETLLYPPPSAAATEHRPVPDWAIVHRELRRPNVTLSLLWEEYRGGTGARDGFGFSWFCQLYREWVGRLKPTLRQVHTAGERVFVDFAGHTMEVIDGATGEVRRAEVFVAVLGASSYTFAEASWTQSLPDWIAVHVNMLTFIGGVPRQIVYDFVPGNIIAAEQSKHAAEVSKGELVRFQECLLCRMRVSPMERRPAGHRSHSEHLHPGSLVTEIDPGFIPVDLSFLGPAVTLRHKRLPPQQTQLASALAHMVAHRQLCDRDVREFRQDAAIETPCGVPLLARRLMIRRQNAINECRDPAQLWLAAFWVVVRSAPGAPPACEPRTSRQPPLSSQYQTHAPDEAARTNPLWLSSPRQAPRSARATVG